MRQGAEGIPVPGGAKASDADRGSPCAMSDGIEQHEETVASRELLLPWGYGCPLPSANASGRHPPLGANIGGGETPALLKLRRG
eukprot:CAMPEP_0170650792 /NCGR_PEP_ID=MMETSP0224-20130122/46003_1 /TAXON_ID=285029 /ORGANISM="Togula jolla, Strain CCCM 725" /LENGTH=83 /DNA_ID=CAMNT_0010982501 /DNA_START=687 /DNA_END=935 /DNA_ORIENTATION=-